MKLFTEDELDQKYNAYFPSDKVKSFNDFLKLAKIERLELSTTEALNEDQVRIPDLKTKLQKRFG